MSGDLTHITVNETIDERREVSIDYLPDGGIVLIVEDPKDVAAIQMGPRHVQQLRNALHSRNWPRALEAPHDE